MRLDRSELSKAVQTALSLGAVAAVGITGTAFAQNATTTQNNQKTPQTLQTIVVTGSHIRRVDLETDNPVVAITSQQLQATGKLTIGSVIQDLPVITGGVNNPSINNGGGSGSTTVGLRGLGPSRTLVLVDGQRVIKSRAGGGADLNAIPTAAVERIEVLTSGASAIYGSDAIGGVINIILKNNYQGAQVQLNYGISDHGDGQREGGSFMFGQTSDKGSVLAGVSYQKFDSIMQSDRSFANSVETAIAENGHATRKLAAATSYNLRDSVILGKGSALAAKFGCPGADKNGTTLSLNPDSFQAGTSPTSTSDYHCITTADAYNFAAVNYILTPQERTNAFFKGVYHLSDNVDFYATVYHDKITSISQLAPGLMGVPTIGGMMVSKDSYYNPFGIDFSPNGADLHLRLGPVGPRISENGNTTDQVVTGVRGNLNILGRNWQWDVGYNYGHVSSIRTKINLPNQAALLPGIANPSMLDPASGQVVCVSTAGDLSTIINGCTPWDPFNLNSPSAQAVLKSAAARAPAILDTWKIERNYHADINGGLFDLPAGTIQLAAGVSYRKEYTDNTVGQAILLVPATGTCQLGSQCSAHLQGGYNVKEAYAELYIPILQDLPFAHGLNVTLSDRYSKYSSFGSTNNWKVGLEWRPIDDLLLRGTVASVFRAPTITNIFGAPVSSAPFLQHDPCDGITTANPACVGVPTDGTFVNNIEQRRSDGTKNLSAQQMVGALTSGSKAAGFPLGPELGKSFDFGVVYSPHFVPGLSVSADFWRIYLNNVITPGVGINTVLNQCFAGNAVWCPLITRVQSGPNAGQLSRLIQPTANLGRIDVSGVDFSAQYKLPQFAFGQFTVGMNATYMQQYKIQTVPGSNTNQVMQGAGMMGFFGSDLGNVCPFAAGGMCFFPRVRAQLNLDWQLGSWSASWRMRGTSPFRMYGASNQGVVENVNRYGTYIYNDLSAGYNIAPINTVVQVGVDNVFDKQPPFLGANRTLNSNTDPQDFDTIGRYYFARMTVKF